MNFTVRRTLSISAALLVAQAVPLRGEVFSFTANRAIPDGLASGVIDSHTISTALIALTDVDVSLTISPLPGGNGGFNGDLYVSLVHDTGFTVLLNRVGRRTSSSFGYADEGFDLTFDDSSIDDIHSYRLTLNGDHQMPLGSVVSGFWQPDGRTTDPSLVIEPSPRNSTLAEFNGLNPNGAWTLFVADVQSGGRLRLDTWSLSLSGIAAVPESSTATATAAAAAVFAIARVFGQRRRRN